MGLLAEDTGATLGELEDRLKAQGFHYLEPDTVTECVVQAVDEVGLEELWPWRVAEDTGPAPLTVEHLGPVDSVMRAGEKIPIWPRRHSELLEERRLTRSGPALYYWVEGTTIQVNPESTEQITVRHYSRQLWTGGGTGPEDDEDTVTIPARIQRVILAFARSNAHLHNGDEAQAMMQRQVGENFLGKLRDQELVPGWDEPDVIRLTEAF